MKTKATKTVYEMVTEKVIEQLNNNVIPWQKPWHGTNEGAINYVTRKPYSLLNQIILDKSGEYLTFNQINSLGGKLKSGAKSSMVVFFKPFTTEKLDEDTGEVEEKTRFVLRYYRVFHIDDTTGIPTKIVEMKQKNKLSFKTKAENIIKKYLGREKTLKLNISLSNRAYYSPTLDEIVIPKKEQYDTIEEYYSTLFHETTHSTGITGRCNRFEKNSISFFGSNDYSKEELVAEIGSAMLCTSLGISSEKAFKNSVSYIKGWLKVLKNDSKMIVYAACKAEKAANYILNVKEK